MLYDVKIHTNDRNQSFIFVAEADDELTAELKAINTLKKIHPNLEVREVESRESRL